MEHGTEMNGLGTSPIAQQRKVLVNIMCYHCPEKCQAMDEHGRPYLRCLMIGGAVNPQTCGRNYAECGE